MKTEPEPIRSDVWSNAKPTWPRERKAVSNRVKKFEETAHEIHDMADRHHKKTEKIDMEATAIRKRARATKKKAQARSVVARKIASKEAPSKTRKVS